MSLPGSHIPESAARPPAGSLGSAAAKRGRRLSSQYAPGSRAGAATNSSVCPAIFEKITSWPGHCRTLTL